MMKLQLIAAATLLLLTACSGQSNQQTAASVNLTSLAGNVAISETAPAPEMASYPKRGDSIARTFAEQPPLIPHKADYAINLKTNRCLTCHAPTKAKRMKATSIPTSHLGDLKGDINGKYYSCTQCHTPQASNTQAHVGNLTDKE